MRLLKTGIIVQKKLVTTELRVLISARTCFINRDTKIDFDCLFALKTSETTIFTPMKI